MSVASATRVTTETAEASSLSVRSGLVQRKLRVGAINDPLELDADRVADQVLAAPVTGAGDGAALFVRRASALSNANAQPEAVPASVEHALARSGAPLEPMLREDMEQRFRHDFSRVRVHSGVAAMQSAADINAHAYTVGHDIVFGARQYSPHSVTGMRLLAHELTHVMQQSPAGSGTIRRQVATAPGAAHQSARKILRVERYWRSPSARVIFQDGSTEEVTFIDGSGLDMSSAPEQRYDKVVDVTIDRTSPIRPHLEIDTSGKGSRVKVETRLAPADRIARLPANARRHVAGAFLNDTDNEADPQQMEFIADMGDALSTSSGAMAISVEGRDPATVIRMQAVDQWIAGQQETLDKVGGWRRGMFNRLLKDIRQIGVTGAVASDDLNAQDVELVLAGVAGGQSDFQAYAEFKRVFQWNVRAGKKTMSQDAADNPEFFIRNDYRRAWKAEAEGLRKLSRIAAAAQVAPFIAIGASAVIGAGGAIGFAAASGISAKLLTTWIGTSLLATSGVEHLLGAREEAKAAGMDTDSPLGAANIVSTAVLRTFGVGEVVENVRNESILTHQDLGRTLFERIVGAGLGTVNALGATSMIVPEAPTVANPVVAPRSIASPRFPGALLAARLRLAEISQGAENARVDLGLNTISSSTVEAAGAAGRTESTGFSANQAIIRVNPSEAPDLPGATTRTVSTSVATTGPTVAEPVATPARVQGDQVIGETPIGVHSESDAPLTSRRALRTNVPAQGTQMGTQTQIGPEIVTSINGVAVTSRNPNILIGADTARFRDDALQIILADPNHPLAAMVDYAAQDWVARPYQYGNMAQWRQFVRDWQAGHAISNNLGGADVIILQSRYRNQFQSAQLERTGAVSKDEYFDIGGIAVDPLTAWDLFDGGFLPLPPPSYPKFDL